MQKELAQGSYQNRSNTIFSWGLRVRNKPAPDQAARVRARRHRGTGRRLAALALLLDAKRGEMVVDFCAGAGGKTLAIGATMQHRRLYAFDVSAHRLDALKPRLARSGLSTCTLRAIAHERDGASSAWRARSTVCWSMRRAPVGHPAAQPDLKWRQSPKAVEELVAKQTAILEAPPACPSRVGACSATCSMLPQENEAIAEAFTQAHRDFEPLDGELLASSRCPKPPACAAAAIQQPLCACGRTATRPTVLCRRLDASLSYLPPAVAGRAQKPPGSRRAVSAENPG